MRVAGGAGGAKAASLSELFDLGILCKAVAHESEEVAATLRASEAYRSGHLNLCNCGFVHACSP